MNASEVASAPDRDPPTEYEHGLLLRTFLDFGLEGALSNPGTDPFWDLRAAAAFLADRLTVPARREEERLRPGTPEREAAAFEHALLRAETDAFIAEIAALTTGAVRGSAARPGLLRRVHRIELLITVHMQAVVDRTWQNRSSPVPASAGVDLQPSVPTTRTGGSHG